MDHLTDKLYLHNSKLHVVIKVYAFKKKVDVDTSLVGEVSLRQ